MNATIYNVKFLNFATSSFTGSDGRTVNVRRITVFGDDGKPLEFNLSPNLPDPAFNALDTVNLGLEIYSSRNGIKVRVNGYERAK